MQFIWNIKNTVPLWDFSLVVLCVVFWFANSPWRVNAASSSSQHRLHFSVFLLGACPNSRSDFIMLMKTVLRSARNGHIRKIKVEAFQLPPENSLLWKRRAPSAADFEPCTCLHSQSIYTNHERTGKDWKSKIGLFNTNQRYAWVNRQYCSETPGVSRGYEMWSCDSIEGWPISDCF